MNSSLFIASMSSPSTLSSAPVRIAVPTLAWETKGYKVNEGPAVIKRNGRIFATFSASATDSNYCMGLLTADENADLLNAASWTKTPTPVFGTSEGSKQYGPGHNSFTVDEAGNDVLVYHARSYRDPIGNPSLTPTGMPAFSGCTGRQTEHPISAFPWATANSPSGWSPPLPRAPTSFTTGQPSRPRQRRHWERPSSALRPAMPRRTLWSSNLS